MRKAADLLPRFVRRLGARPKGRPALVGVSGGVDSVVLLDLLQLAGCAQPIVAHFHHGLRGRDADLDAEFVRELAKDADMKFVLGRGKTRARAERTKASIEEAARALRREFFAHAARKHGASVVFLAHHAGDAAETMLFHLARGGGRRGLGSLRTEADLVEGIVIVRPLLAFTRAEVEKYAKARKLAWREDKSNASREFTRNRLRHDVMPRLAKAVGHDPVPVMARAGEILAAEEEWLAGLVAAEASSAQLEVRALRRMHVAHQRRLLRAWLAARTRGEVDFETIENARALAMSKDQPAKMNLPRAHHLRRRAGKLFVERARRTK
ncbi:MAG: tRNA lysidine(34) synthetase TilS [Chthoniobacterales bacterium]